MYNKPKKTTVMLRASAWYPGDWGFIPCRVTLKTLKIVFAAFAPGAWHKRKCEGFCVRVIRHVGLSVSLNSVQSFVIDNCNGPPIESGLNQGFCTGGEFPTRGSSVFRILFKM